LLKDVGIGGRSDYKQAEAATRGVLTVYGIMTGNQKVIDKAKDRKGNINIDLRGATTSDVRKQILDNLDEFIRNYDGNVHFQF